tara:strand:+ start:98 stop:976 length:879 start_codon:yes stop_codon:yes gene_type:complete
MRWFEIVARMSEKSKAYVIVTVLEVRGSSPREEGAKMIVTEDQSYLSIGGGNLEYQAIALSRELILEAGLVSKIEDFPLGPKVGQCCGGKVRLLFESFPAETIRISIFGAGHVGKALIGIVSQLPYRIRWIDSREHEFPKAIPSNVEKVVSGRPHLDIRSSSMADYFVVMSHSHKIDFEIVQAVLKMGNYRYLGLIGSESKKKRFESRLIKRGVPDDQISRLSCPMGIGQITGKSPIEVAVSVASELISDINDLESDPVKFDTKAEAKELETTKGLIGSTRINVEMEEYRFE